MKRIESIEDIQYLICLYCDVSLRDLLGGDRRRRLVTARKIAMYLCRYKLNATFLEISEKFNRHYTTVIQDLQKFETDPKMTYIRERNFSDIEISQNEHKKSPGKRYITRKLLTYIFKEVDK